MNFHGDEWIMKRMIEHYNEACSIIPENRIVGVWYQGSGNYGMDYEDSDVDTKCIVLPSIRQLCNDQPMSMTHVRANDEHIDFKDVRLMFEIFKKQNLNFIEILFTKYYIINPSYADLWNAVAARRDEIVCMNQASLLKSMKGIAGEKYHAMEHRYPSRIEWVDKWGYDPKQLHHLLRIKDFMSRWTAGEAFADCFVPHDLDWLVEVKKGLYDLKDARRIGKEAMDDIQKMYDRYLEICSYTTNMELWNFLEDVSYEMIKKGIKKEVCF